MIATPTSMGRLLIVDGDAEGRRMLTAPLRRAGYEMAETDDGDDALHRLAEGRTDLVFFLQRSAGRQGIEFLAAARERDPEVPVVILCSEGTVRDAVESCKQGVWDYLVPPVGEADLLAIVRRALLRRAVTATGFPRRIVV